jgi:hypothetical protein
MWPNLQWGNCNHDFNDEYCYDLYRDLYDCQVGNNGTITDEYFFNFDCMAIGDICLRQRVEPLNGTHCFNQTSGINVTLHQVIPRVLSAEQYF